MVKFPKLIIEEEKTKAKEDFIKSSYQLYRADFQHNAKVKATIKLPENVEYIEAFRQEYAGANQSKEDVKYDEKSRTVTFNVGDIEAKSAAKYNFILRVKTIKEEDVNMQVVVKGKGTNEQRSSIIIHSTGNNKLEIKTETDITKDYLQIGDVVTYTITAKNVSSGVIKNVRIKATIPDNLKYLNTTLPIPPPLAIILGKVD